MKEFVYNTNKKRIIIDKFNNFDYDSMKFADKIYTKGFYNYYPTTKLKNSSGIGPATFPVSFTDNTERELNIADLGLSSIDGVAYFKQYFPEQAAVRHRILLYGSDKKLYINELYDNDYKLYWLYNLTFNSCPITLSYKKDDSDAIILATTDRMMVWHTNLSPYNIENAPIITSMCINDGVLFCTIKEPAYKIWYATDLDAENIGNISSNSGYISLEDNLGYARKIITYNENVYVIRDYGISKILFISHSGISISQVYISDTLILSDTVSVSGNVIMFMTKNGIFSYNGVKVSAVDANISSLLPNENPDAVAASLAGKYYIALKLDFHDEKDILCEQADFTNNALIIVDANDYSYEVIRGVDIKNMLPLMIEGFERMLLTFNSEHNEKLGHVINGSVCFDEPLPKYWSSGDLVGDEKVKTFTKLNVYAEKDIRINLLMDGKITCFTTYKSGLNEFGFKQVCKQIKLEISSINASANVEHIALDYYEA